MKSLRWRITLWFTFSLLAVIAVFVAITYRHLENELRIEKWERGRAENKDWALHGSYSEAEVNDIAGELWRSALLYAVPVALLALGLGYYLARRSLQPVADMNRQLRTIGARSLDHRVRLADVDEEFRAIENNINALLARLDTSFRQLTEFSAQVAHELRTPLTLIRLQVEEVADQLDPALAESLQDELRRLADYVDQCLLLATAEQGRINLEIRPVALHALMLEMLEVYELLARSENRPLTVAAAEEVTVSADVRSLRQILHNLLTNALRHGEGPIVVTVGREEVGSFCRIENAVGRKPSAAGAGHTLGLRLVRALTALHPQLTFVGTVVAGQFIAELRWHR